MHLKCVQKKQNFKHVKWNVDDAYDKLFITHNPIYCASSLLFKVPHLSDELKCK